MYAAGSLDMGFVTASSRTIAEPAGPALRNACHQRHSVPLDDDISTILLLRPSWIHCTTSLTPTIWEVTVCTCDVSSGPGGAALTFPHGLVLNCQIYTTAKHRLEPRRTWWPHTYSSRHPNRVLHMHPYTLLGESYQARPPRQVATQRTTVLTTLPGATVDRPSDRTTIVALEAHSTCHGRRDLP